MGTILVVNAGSTSLKLHAVEDDRKSTRVESFEDAPARIEAVAHRVVHGGLAFPRPRRHRQGSAGTDPRTRNARASSQRPGPRSNRRCPAGASPGTSCRRLRYVVSPHDSRRSGRVRSAACLERAMGDSPVRISRPLRRLVRAACTGAAWPCRRSVGRLPSRGRLLCDGRRSPAGPSTRRWASHRSRACR